MKPPKAVFSYVAAATLALITLFTFFVFQNFGPQGVIRRFHVAAVSGDITAIDRLTTEAVPSQTTLQMIDFVLKLGGENASYEVVDIKRSRGEILVGVQYRFPNGFGIGVVWHVRQMQHDWRIDCRATAAGLVQQVRGTG
jgi:hypothetical protein